MLEPEDTIQYSQMYTKERWDVLYLFGILPANVLFIPVPQKSLPI